MLNMYRQKSTCHQLSQAVTSLLKGSDRESAKVGFSSQGGLHREATRECGSSRRVGRGICFADFPTPTVLWPERVATGTAKQACVVPVRRHPSPVAAPRSPDYPAAPSTRLGVGFLLSPTTVLVEVRPAMKSAHPFSTTFQRNLPHETKCLPQGPSRKPA